MERPAETYTGRWAAVCDQDPADGDPALCWFEPRRLTCATRRPRRNRAAGRVAIYHGRVGSASTVLDACRVRRTNMRNVLLAVSVIVLALAAIAIGPGPLVNRPGILSAGVWNTDGR